MKKKSDPRHKARIAAVKNLFAKSFGQGLKNQEVAQKVLEKRRVIDKLIEKHAPAWPIRQIPPIDLAVLRLAIYELELSSKKEPYKVVIDEAVEIAKEFGGQASPAFINGVLGSIIKSREKN